MDSFLGELQINKKNDKKGKSNTAGTVKYSCNFSQKNFTNDQFKKEIQDHNKELSQAVLVDCSYNKIEILVLRNFKVMETLKASNNIIKRADLQLSNLKCLDLSYNKLKEVPNLRSLHNLEIVLLNDNYIQNLKLKSFEEITTLTALELSRNKIRFESVEEFSIVIGFIAENFEHLNKISVVENPFTYEEIFREKYFDYMSHKIIPLKKLNNKSLINLIKSKDMPGALLGLMLEKEKKSKNASANLERIVLNFEKILLDRSELEAKFPKVEEKLIEYTKDILEEHFEEGDEYINDDKDTQVFENFINLINFAIEDTNKFNEKLVNLFILFSSVRKGKWAKQCFNFLKHICNSDESLQPKVEEQIYQHYYKLFYLLKNIDGDTKLNSGAVFTKKVTGIQLEDVIDQMPLIVRGIKHFINSKFPKLVKMFYTNLMFLFESGFYCPSKLDIIFQHVFKQNDIIVKSKENYERTIKLNFFKYAIKVIYLATRSKCIHHILENMKEIHVEKLFELAMIFYDNMIIDESQRFAKMFNRIIHRLFTICRKLIYNPNFNLNQISKEMQMVINVVEKSKHKFKIMEKLKDYLNNYYMNGEYKLYTNLKILLPRQELQDKIQNNKIFGLLFKLYVHITSLFNDDIFKNLNNIIGLVMNTYTFTEQSINEGKIKMEFDPQMATLANYIILHIMKNYNIFWRNDLTSYKVFFQNTKGKLELILQFIDDQSEMYRNACRIAYIYSYGEVGTDINCISSIALNSNTYIGKLVSSMLNFLAYFGKQGKYEENEEIRKQFSKFNASLNLLGRDKFLIDCLKVPSETIKIKIMSCFLTVKYDEIATDELSGLLRTISNANWLEGRMEKIIADTFYFIMKLFHENFINNSALPFENTNVLDISLKILEKNSARTTYRKDDIENIKSLNISIIMLLINISGYQNYTNVLDKGVYAELIKNTIFNEYQAENSKKKYESEMRSKIMFPLDIEKCFTLWKIENIKNIFTGQNGLPPYNYVSLRILIHMGNVLMNIPYKTFDIYKTDIFNSKEILDEIYENETFRVKLEKENWKKFKKEIIFKFGEIYNNYASNPFYLRLNELIFQNNHIEQHYKFVENFRFFLEWMTGETNQGGDLAEVFIKQKYDPQLAFPDKLDFFKKDTNALIEVINLLNSECDEKAINDRDIGEFTKFVLRTNNEKKSYFGKSTNTISVTYSHLKNDLNVIDSYGDTVESIIRDSSLETVDNVNIRSLFISAFLRCIYAVLKVSPVLGFGKIENKYRNISQKNSPKTKLISILRTKEFFQKLVILVDTSKLTNCNVSSKFLTILNFIFVNLNLDYDPESGSDYIEKLIMLSAMIISKILGILNSHNGDQEEYSLINALVKCCLTISKELNFINMNNKTKFDLIDKVMSRNLINVLISTIGDYMTKQDQELTDTSNKKRIKYLMIYERIARLFAEYMSLSDENGYYIMEVLFDKLIIDKKYVRKTFIQEVMELHKCFRLKYNVKESLEIKDKNKNLNQSSEDKIIFVSDCLLFDCKDEEIEKMFFFLTRKYIYFYQFNENYLKKKFDFNEILLSNVEQEYKLDLNEIHKFYFTEFTNRIFISMKNRGFSVLFKNTLRVLELFHSLNTVVKDSSFQFDFACNIFDKNDIVISENDNNDNNENSLNLQNDIKIGESLDNDKMIDDSVDQKLNKLNKGLKTSSEFKLIFMKNYQDKKKKEDEERKENNVIILKTQMENIDLNKNMKTKLNIETQNITLINNNVHSINSTTTIKKKLLNENIFLISEESKKICDFFSSENRYVKNPKILVFNVPDNLNRIDKNEPNFTPTLSIYIEKYDDILKLEVNDDYLKKDKSVWYKNIYVLDWTYNLNQLEHLTFQSPNIIIATIKGYSLKMNFLDDYSFFNVRSILLTVSKSKNFQKLQI